MVHPCTTRTSHITVSTILRLSAVANKLQRRVIRTSRSAPTAVIAIFCSDSSQKYTVNVSKSSVCPGHLPFSTVCRTFAEPCDALDVQCYHRLALRKRPSQKFGVDHFSRIQIQRPNAVCVSTVYTSFLAMETNPPHQFSSPIISLPKSRERLVPSPLRQSTPYNSIHSHHPPVFLSGLRLADFSHPYPPHSSLLAPL